MFIRKLLRHYDFDIQEEFWNLRPCIHTTNDMKLMKRLDTPPSAPSKRNASHRRRILQGMCFNSYTVAHKRHGR